MTKKWTYLFLFCSLLPIKVIAAISTTTFNVTATINAACNVSASNLAFGVYNPLLLSTLAATTTINVTCTTGSTYNIGLDQGAGTGATVANRLMTQQSGGTNTIAYSLYQNSGHTTVWGNTIGTDTVSGTGSGSQQGPTVYGMIFSSNPATLPPASYSDTINVTVTF